MIRKTGQFKMFPKKVSSLNERNLFGNLDIHGRIVVKMQAKLIE
jgi:hypothetical protein